MANEKHYLPIRQVAELTGVNPITLRAWERRYELIVPHRTAKGHRVYSDQDIARIHQILQLLDQGIPISQTKSLLDKATTGGQVQLQQQSWQHYLEQLRNAIANFNLAELDQQYNELLSLYPIDVVTEKIILPTMQYLGEQWQNEISGIAQEHFFSTYLRNKIGARLHHELASSHNQRLIFACLPEERHEFGLLLFALFAIRKGYQPIILGTNLPITQLVPAQEKIQAAAIILRGELNPDRYDELTQQAEKMKIPCFVQSRLHFAENNYLHWLTTSFTEAWRTIKSQLK